ncbi:MAG: 3-oxoacyl-[acyl-carrier-protein] synthase III C-terminal domain-containing protein [Bacteroidota bacterium]
MEAIHVQSIHYRIPETQLGIPELLAQVDPSDLPRAYPEAVAYTEFLRETFDLDAIRVEDGLPEEVFVTEMLEAMLDEGTVDPSEIDVILLAQEDDKRQKLNLAQYVQYELDLPGAQLMTISGNHCANLDFGLQTAAQLLRGDERIRQVLLLGSVRVTDPKVRLVGTYGVIGDGAAAMVVSREPGPLELLGTCAINNGYFHDVDLNKDESLLHLKYYTQAMQGALETARMAPEDIHQVIIQNANPMLVTPCVGSLGIEESRIFLENFSRYGHLDCLDFPVNLKDYVQSETAAQGDNILAFGTGWAGSYIGTVLNIHAI